MAIIQWDDKFKDLENKFWNLEEKFFDKFHSEFPKIRIQKVNIKDTKDKLIIEIEIPGAKQENISIRIINNIVLKIEAKIENIKEEKKQGYCKREINTQSFYRTITLPCEVIEEKTEAEYENGILIITAQKMKIQKEKKQIIIKTKSSNNKNNK